MIHLGVGFVDDIVHLQAEITVLLRQGFGKILLVRAAEVSVVSPNSTQCMKGNDTSLE